MKEKREAFTDTKKKLSISPGPSLNAYKTESLSRISLNSPLNKRQRL